MVSLGSRPSFADIYIYICYTCIQIYIYRYIYILGSAVGSSYSGIFRNPGHIFVFFWGGRREGSFDDKNLAVHFFLQILLEIRVRPFYRLFLRQNRSFQNILVRRSRLAGGRVKILYGRFTAFNSKGYVFYI